MCICPPFCILNAGILFAFREKAGLAEDIKNKQELVQQRRVELEGLQGGVTSATEQREKLEKDREEASKLLEQLDAEVKRGRGSGMMMCTSCFVARENRREGR